MEILYTCYFFLDFLALFPQGNSYNDIYKNYVLV